MLLLLLFQYQMIVALGVGLKCPRKVHLNTKWGGGDKNLPKLVMDSSKKQNVI